MRKTYSQDFEGVRVKTTLLPATKGINVLSTFGQLAGPALAQVALSAGGADDEATDADNRVALAGLQVAIEALFAKLDEGKVQRWLRDCLDGTEVVETTDQGETVTPIGAVLDDLFAGRYLLLFRIAKWVFEVNFREVFSSVTIAGKALRRPPVVTPESP